MKRIFVAVYALVLVTQLPHIFWAYRSLELAAWPLAQWTALGAAVAFELSIGVFTWRVVNGSKRRITRLGLLFFIAGSGIANGYYYQWWPFAFDRIMPVFATVALPLSLALFAEEFGRESRRQELAEKRAERAAEREQAPVVAIPEPFACAVCGKVLDSQAALNGHQNAHRTNGNERSKERDAGRLVEVA